MSEPDKREGKSATDGKAFDPFEAWRGMRDAGLEAWAKAMTEAVNSEEYAKATGVMLDAYLTASIPLREMLEKAMTQALEQMNMPTRADFTSIAERLTQVELRLDDMDAKLDELAKSSPESAGTKPATAKAKGKEAREQ